ncbi:UDP-N-acetylmuramate dehydrogenase [Blattabacterium cuenoti]|uniref:UDP-N-acetylmuramate dehydrogenase n=1 Tax=Blattabacterium cuenoti TaxID=1653831 RepID=UPI00163CAB86|nr:UDP-N-acetylmuramate dehydrogenase [Blattabacterium cuenoti]
MLIKQNFSLKKLNTFGVDVYARYYTEIHNLEDIRNIFLKEDPSIPKCVLGNGSNILFLNDYYSGLVIKMNMKGKKVVYENKDQVLVQAYAGEDWNEFVEWTIINGFSGLETLSFIPGTVGASPIQNIGAYGTEVKECLLKVVVYEINSNKIIEIPRKKCRFQYRNSIFRNPDGKNQFVILSVFFILKKNKYQKFNSFYVEIRKELKNMNIRKPNLFDLRKAIFNIRRRKIPNPKIIGNAGSFFKNPIIENTLFQKLKNQYPNIIGIYILNNKIKISASYLIEHIGWKGKKIGNVGIHDKNPLILVNYGGASGMDIYNISVILRKEVQKKFGIFLSKEVNIIR